MANKLVVIINSLNVPKIKEILLYEMKFLIQNYSCLQNPWLAGYRPQIPVPSVLNWICWTPLRTKFLGTPLLLVDIKASRYHCVYRTRYLERVALFRTELLVDCVWNVMAHAQKPDFVFRPKGRVHLNRRGASVQSTTGSRGVRISGCNARYTMFRGSVKSTGYPLHSLVSPFTSSPVHHNLSYTIHVR